MLPFTSYVSNYIVFCKASFILSVFLESLSTSDVDTIPSSDSLHMIVLLSGFYADIRAFCPFNILEKNNLDLLTDVTTPVDVTELEKALQIHRSTTYTIHNPCSLSMC